MKRSLALLVAIFSLVVAETPHAALIVHEPFDYPVGNLTNLNGGTGWPVPWTNTGNGTIVAPGLVYDDIWNRLISSSNACGMNTVANARDLPATYGSAGQTIYVSFIGRVDSAFLAGLLLGNVRIGRVTQPTWQVSDLSGVVIDSGLTSTQTSLIVVRLDFAASTVNIRLYVNPPLAAEPGAPTGSATRPTFTFNRVAVFGSGANVRLIDEIRLGTTWTDVTPHAPAPLQLYAGNVSLPEGNIGTTDFAFNVGLNQTHNQTVTVDFLTANGTALAGSDYAATNGSLTFNPGETNKTVTVGVNGDATVEYDEAFRLVLTNSVNAGISSLAGAGTGTILDDDFVIPALFAEEQFQYPNGSGIPGLNGGTGWSNTWVGTFGGAAVTSPGLTHTAAAQVLAVSSNAASLNGSFVAQSRQVRDLERVKDGTLYVSFLGRVDSGLVALTLNQSGVPRFSMGRNFFSANWNVSHPLGDWSIISAVPATTQSLIVVRVDYSGSNMTVRLYVNPALNAEPAAPVGQTNLPAARFDSIALSTAGFSSGVAAFDEIRVATTWAATVPLGVLPPPNINVSDATVVEGDSNTTNLVFTVSLSRTNDQAVMVNFATTNGTAIVGSDYVATNGVLTFTPGQTNLPVIVVVNGDTNIETNETFSLLLGNAVNGVISNGTGIGTILDDDTPPAIYALGGRVMEGDSNTVQAAVNMYLSHPWKHTVVVSFATTNGTAVAGVDYVATNGVVTFAVGETEAEIPVTVNGDTLVETNEYYGVLFSNPMNATLGIPGRLGLIGDDDALHQIGDVIDIVKTDDPVPGEPGRFFRKFIDAPVINEFNEVAFIAVTDNAANNDPETGVWAGAKEYLTKLASTKTQPPDLPSTVDFTGQFAAPNIDDEGRVFFLAQTTNTSGPILLAEGLSAAGEAVLPIGWFAYFRLLVTDEYYDALFEKPNEMQVIEGVAPISKVDGMLPGETKPKTGQRWSYLTGEFGNINRKGVLACDLFTGESKVIAEPGKAVPGSVSGKTIFSARTEAIAGKDRLVLAVDQRANEFDQPDTLLGTVWRSRMNVYDWKYMKIVETGDMVSGGGIVEYIEGVDATKGGDVYANVNYAPMPNSPRAGLLHSSRNPFALTAAYNYGSEVFGTGQYITAGKDLVATVVYHIGGAAPNVAIQGPSPFWTQTDFARIGSSLPVYGSGSSQTIASVDQAVTDFLNGRKVITSAGFGSAGGGMAILSLDDGSEIVIQGGPATGNRVFERSANHRGSGSGLNDRGFLARQALYDTANPPMSQPERGRLNLVVVDQPNLPTPPLVDFGDTPDAPSEPNYPTTSPRNGARHVVRQTGPRLGQRLDADSGLLQNFSATADDEDQFNDEDGITFLSRILPGCSAQVSVVASTAAKLDAWIDFNQDGDWDDEGEKIFNNVSVNAGTNVLSFTGSTNIVRPGGIVHGLAYARFRLSTDGNLNYFGLATDGEVEDHIAPLGMVLLVAPGPQPQQLAFSWQDACELYVLQHTPQLNPANWQDVSSGTLSNGNWYQTINLTIGSGYYRLRLKP